MDRRTLLKSTIGIYAYTRIAPAAFAKENETHGDDVSMLYGNAWDILPQAADGKTEIVISSLITEKDDVWGDSYYICGVIHNNTDDECVLRKIDLQETSTDDYPTIWPLTIQPRSYALMRAEIIFDGEPSDDLTGMVPTFESPDANYDFRMDRHRYED